MEVVERYNIYDWILVVYIHEIPYYIHQSDAIVKCIVEAVPPRARVAVFVIREAVRQVMEPLAAGGVGEVLAGDVIDPGRRGPVNYYRLTVSELQFDERGMGGLVEVLVGGDWRQALRATFPRVRARRRMFVSFSHGAAFGINVDMEGLARVKVGGELPILWSVDLAAELETCLGGQPIDVLLLNNCYMQSFETGYALKDQVRFIVAAEGALGALGYDYAGLMKRLLEPVSDDDEPRDDDAPSGDDEPSDEVDALVKGIIGDYAGAIFHEEQAGQAVFANRAGEYGKVLALLERMTAILVERMDEAIDVLVDIRENKLLYVSAPLNGYASNYLCMIDLFAWVRMVFERLGDLFGGTGLAADFAALRLRVVVAGKVGEGLVAHDAVMPVYGYSGLSIFYPRAADWPMLRPIPSCAPLVGGWRGFLEAYSQAGYVPFRTIADHENNDPLPRVNNNPDPSRGPGIKC